MENRIVQVLVGDRFRVSDRTHTWRTKLSSVLVGHGFRVSDRTHTWRTKLFWWWLVTVFGCRTGYTRGEQKCPDGDQSRFSGVGQDTHVENNIVQATWWLVTVFSCRKTLGARKLRYHIPPPPPPPHLSPVPNKP